MADIHFQPVVPASDIVGYKLFTFGFRKSLKVAGIYALVNRWVKMLMTPVGSDPLRPEEGTGFTNIIGSNTLLDSPELRDATIIAVDEASEQVQVQDNAGSFPESEMLDSAQLDNFIPSVSGDGFDMWVTVTSRTGITMQIRLAELATR
jgi:hypothetical protein